MKIFIDIIYDFSYNTTKTNTDMHKLHICTWVIWMSCCQYPSVMFVDSSIIFSNWNWLTWHIDNDSFNRHTWRFYKHNTRIFTRHNNSKYQVETTDIYRYLYGLIKRVVVHVHVSYLLTHQPFFKLRWIDRTYRKWLFQ